MPFPFELPTLSRGFAALTPAARETGTRAVVAAAGALASLLGREVAIRARTVPGVPAPRAAAAALPVELTALPARAVLEVDPGLVVSLVDALAGGDGAATASSALTPIEAAALELLALAAVDGACSVGEIEASLAPRLSRGAVEPASALAIELELAAGAARGRGRLLLPPVAVRALRGNDRCEGAGGGIPIPLSVRSGSAPLRDDELAALADGDVLLLDVPPAAPDALVMPGGSCLLGRLEDGAFHVEEVTMKARTAELPVLIEVELARVEIPLADLARLEPGAALPLGIDRHGVVTLRMGERAIGRGELVEVDGTVGVRVLALEGSP
jgi:type III secretion protein Q